MNVWLWLSWDHRCMLCRDSELILKVQVSHSFPWIILRNSWLVILFANLPGILDCQCNFLHLLWDLLKNNWSYISSVLCKLRFKQILLVFLPEVYNCIFKDISCEFHQPWWWVFKKCYRFMFTSPWHCSSALCLCRCGHQVRADLWWLSGFQGKRC